MSEENTVSEENTEQITKKPDTKRKIKEPWRVKQGNTLRDYHKRAKEALNEKEARDKKGESDEGASMDVNAWIPSLSFQNVLTLGSIGLAAYALFTNYRSRIADLHVPTRTFNPPPVKTIDDRPPAQEINLKDDWM